MSFRKKKEWAQQWWQISVAILSSGGTNDPWAAFIECFSPQMIQSLEDLQFLQLMQ